MILQCGWCQRKLGELPPLEKEYVTHGICEECKKLFYKEAEEDRVNQKVYPSADD